MKKALIAALLATGCAPSSYYYSFDLIDSGAQNLTKPGQRDTIEDDNVKTEILVDPTSFQAILLDLTNKTDRTLEVQWDQINMVGPDGNPMPVRPDQQLGWIAPSTKVVARLLPFALPPTGDAATAYNNTKFELDVPMVVRGQPKVYQYHMVVHTQKL